MTALLQTTIGRLRIIGFVEGVSFLLLLGIAMPLKYFAEMPGPVRVVGMAHGILFLLYVWMAFNATLEHRWTKKTLAALLVASVLPGGPFYVDAKLLREAEESELSPETASQGR